MREIDGVLHDVDLVLERRRDVHRGVGDDQRIEMPGHIHDEAMADPPLGADAGVARDHRGHQLIGVQAALHQRRRLALPHQGHRLGRGIVAVRRLDDRQIGNVDAVPCRHVADAGGRADQDRLDQAQPACLHGAAERHFIARMRHSGDDRRQFLRRVDQTQILVVRLAGARAEAGSFGCPCCAEYAMRRRDAH